MSRSRPAAMAVVLMSCGTPAPRASEDSRVAVARSIDSATRAFEAAQRSRDVDGILAHLSPDFYMYVDGQRMDYESVVSGIRNSFSAAQHVEPGFQDIKVIVQGAEAGVSSFSFRDSVVMADGTLQRNRGATTLVWARSGSSWVIRYAHADHRPVTDP